MSYKGLEDHEGVAATCCFLCEGGGHVLHPCGDDGLPLFGTYLGGGGEESVGS